MNCKVVAPLLGSRCRFITVVDGNELKLVIFADDMTSFVHDKQSHLALFNTIMLFSTYSGLCVNHDKTEILLIGNMEIKSSELGVKEISKVVKILGVHFTNNHSVLQNEF